LFTIREGWEKDVTTDGDKYTWVPWHPKKREIFPNNNVIMLRFVNRKLKRINGSIMLNGKKFYLKKKESDFLPKYKENVLYKYLIDNDGMVIQKFLNSI